jgi:hypothetical protein
MIRSVAQAIADVAGWPILIAANAQEEEIQTLLFQL